RFGRALRVHGDRRPGQRGVAADTAGEVRGWAAARIGRHAGACSEPREVALAQRRPGDAPRPERADAPGHPGQRVAVTLRPMRPEVRVSDQLTENAAALLAEAAERGGHIVITGGSTPKAAYERVAALGAD